MAAKAEGGPCVFLSHSGIDSDAAIELKRRILATEAARQAGLQVWLDKDDLLPGVEDWQKQLEIALTRKATAFAVMVGSKGVVNWVEREVRIGLSRATGDGAIPFVAVLAKDSPGVSALPAFAQQHQAVSDPLNNEVELQRLVAAILSRKPAETPLLAEPFVGLRSMREEDAGRFFGRDEEIRELIAALRRHRLLAIVADSGAGKSSLAMAGLAPAFRGGAFADPAGRGPDRRAWHVVIMRPGDDPLEGMRRGLTEAAERMRLPPSERAALRMRLAFDNLSESAYALRCDLPAAEAETLLIVDQFEELLTETPEKLRAPFVDFLIRLAALREPGGFRVLLTVRADYFNLCKPYADLYGTLAAASDPATLRLKRISDKGLEEAVRRPLELAGYRKPDDTERLAVRTRRDLSDRPGDLALAQMALYVVWRRRKAPDGTLIDAYTDVGGVTGALAQEAERVRTEKLAPAEAALLAPLFVRLIRLGDTGGAIRRICLRSELDPARLDLADKLCSDEFGRLLLAGDGTFDVCHEALITQWPWLQDELHRSAGDLRDFDPLMRRASAWAAAPESDKEGHLATGVERAAFSALAQRRPGWLSAAEVAFVAASDQSHKAELDYREQQRQAQARALTFRKWTTRVAMAASIVFAAVAAFAVWSALDARKQTEIAEEARRTAETETARAEAATAVADLAARVATLNETISLAALSRVAVVDGFPVDAAKLALTSWPSEARPERPKLTRSLVALAGALPGLTERLRVTTGGRSVGFSPDGSRFVAGGRDGISIRDVATGAEQEKLIAPGFDPSAAFSTDGRSILYTAAGGEAWLWDPAINSVRQLAPDLPAIQAAAFSPDGTRIAVVGNRLGRILDASGTKLSEWQTRAGYVTSIAFSPSGRLLVVGEANGGALVWDIASDDIVGEYDVSASVNAVAFSPDSTRVATAESDGAVRIWAATSGAVLQTLAGHSASVLSLAFSPDGRMLASASSDREVILWNLSSEKPVMRFRGHEAAVTDVAFSPDVSELLTTAADWTSRLWRLPPGRDVWSTPLPVTPHALAVSPGGERIATVLTSTFAMFGADGRLEGVGPQIETVMNVAFSGDGRRFVTASWVEGASVWDAASRERIATFARKPGTVTGSAVALSPDGATVAFVTTDGKLHLWDVATQRELVQFLSDDSTISSLAFSPDGKTLASAHSDRKARLWDLRDRNVIRTFDGHMHEVNAIAFSADGGRLVTGSEDQTASVWDVASGTELVRLVGNTRGVRSVSFSDDGARILTLSHESELRIWDAATGAELIRLPDSAEAAAFLPGGKAVAIASGGAVRLRDISSVETGNGFEIACMRLGGNTEVDAALKRYGLASLPPVCAANPPLPFNLQELE